MATAWGVVTWRGARYIGRCQCEGAEAADTEGCYSQGCGSELMHFSDLCFGNFTISVPVDHL